MRPRLVPEMVLDPAEPIYTLAQVATRLAVNPETLRRAIRAGRLRAIVLPGSAGTRITDRALNDYLRSLERGFPIASAPAVR